LWKTLFLVHEFVKRKQTALDTANRQILTSVNVCFYIAIYKQTCIIWQYNNNNNITWQAK